MTNKAILHDLVVKKIERKSALDLLNAEIKIIKQDIMELDNKILQEMNESQQTMARIEGYTVSVTTQNVFTPTDWADFNSYCEENKCSYLFQRRVTQKAVEEMLKLNPDLPVEQFTKYGVSMRKVPGGK